MEAKPVPETPADGSKEQPKSVPSKKNVAPVVWQRESSSVLEMACILMSTCGFIVGFGNIRSFPYNALENGGLWFVVFHIIFSLVAGLPLLFFEFLIGQVTQVGITLVYGKYCKLANGIGISFFIMCLVFPAFDQNTGSDTPGLAARVLFDTAFKNSPMLYCTNEWNTQDCVSLYESEKSHNCNETGEFYYSGICGSYNYSTIYTEDSVQQYLNYFDTGANQFDIFRYLTPMLIFVVPLGLILLPSKILFFVYGGSAFFFFCLLLAFFIQSTFMNGTNTYGWEYFWHRTQANKFFNFKALSFCITEAMYSLSLMGTLGSLGSFLKPKDNAFKIAGIAVFVDILCSLLSLSIFINSISFMKTLEPESGYFYNKWDKFRYTTVILPQTTALEWNTGFWFGVLALIKILASFNQSFCVVSQCTAVLRDHARRFTQPQFSKYAMFGVFIFIQIQLIILTTQSGANGVVRTFATRIPAHFFCSRFLYVIGLQACIKVYGQVDFLVDLSHKFPLKEGWKEYLSPIGPVMFFLWDYFVPISLMLSQIWILLVIYVDINSLSAMVVAQSFLAPMVLFLLPIGYSFYILATYLTKGKIEEAWKPSLDHPSYSRIEGNRVDPNQSKTGKSVNDGV